MQEFDPRRPTVRYAPRAFACVAAATVLALAAPLIVQGGQSSAKARSTETPSLVALTKATAAPADFRAGLAIEAAARPRPLQAPLPPPASIALRLRQIDAEAGPEASVAQGRLSDSLSVSALEAGAPPDLTAQAVKLFAHKLDLSRDIHSGDSFRLLFGRSDDLLYAEVGARDALTRVYRYRPTGAAEAGFFDDLGRNIQGFLLRTPVDGARVSSGFGERLHPILGYTRMHQGIDFAAPAGAPVYAAGDGVVEEIRWAGGYGRWLKIRHGADWETGYGHLSRWAVQAGDHVQQGQVVAYVGSTGEATGPHLHYEVMMDGRKINPKDAQAPLGAVLEGGELAAFKLHEARVDALLASAEPTRSVQLALADAGGGLRRAER